MTQLIFLKNGQPILKRPIDSGKISIGRDASCDIQLLDSEISRQHCTIEKQNGLFVLRDLSRNGTFVNNQRVAVTSLKTSDVIQIGPWVLKMALENSVPPEETVIKEKSKSKNENALGSMLGVSKQMRRVFGLIRKGAASPATICLIGESGTGKELAARSIHDLSERRGRPFVAVNCGAIPGNLIESLLFGHEKGSFTGATDRHNGVFEEANHGTLFLDEIGEMPLDLQTRLLRVLEDQIVRRVGGKADIPVNVRLIAATNRNLKQLVSGGKFRQDLFYRLYIFPIELAPLRERQDDIVLLAHHFVKLLSPKGEKISFAPEALEKLRGHAWRGNVRELKNVIQRTLLLMTGETIQPKEIELTAMAPLPDDSGGLKLDEQEKFSIEEALRKARGNHSLAARHLGIARTTLAAKVRRHSIDSKNLV